MVKEKKFKKIIRLIILPILIAIYCFRDVNIGVDLADTGYNIERVFNFLNCSGETVLSTFWSDYIGYLMTKLPGAGTWLGMMCYCTIIVLLIALIAYYFCIHFMNCYVVFVCEIVSLALFWVPASVLYDSLTFLFFEIAIVLLYYALKKDKNIFFILAGMVLGINTLVRIPNMAQISLIIVVWYYAWWKRNELVRASGIPWVVEKTGLCIGGYVSGIIISVFTSLHFYEWDTYIKVFFQLSEKTDVAGYGLSEMAFGTLRYILSHSGYILFLVLIVAITYSAKRLVEKNSVSENRKVWLHRIISLFAMFLTALAIGVAYNYFELFTVEYDKYSSMKRLMALVYLWGIFIGIINIIYKCTNDIVIMYILYLIILWTIPLGSSNQIYLDISNSFLLLPIICYFTNSFIKKRSEKNGLLFVNCCKMVIAPVVGLVLIQVLLFGENFVFGENNVNSKFTTESVLQGMKTSDEKVKALDGLMKFVNDINVEYEGVLQYCGSPGLIYVLQEKRGVERSWSELDTYPVEKFEEELLKVERSGKFPLVILNTDMAKFYDIIYGDSNAYVENADVYMMDKKVRALLRFINNNGYKEVYNELMYAVFVVE